jgi:hypothetical protein
MAGAVAHAGGALSDGVAVQRVEQRPTMASLPIGGVAAA